jgi:hypothetical protein
VRRREERGTGTREWKKEKRRVLEELVYSKVICSPLHLPAAQSINQGQRQIEFPDDLVARVTGT